MANTKTLAIKARLANSLRKYVYQNIHRKPNPPQSIKAGIFDMWLLEIWEMHSELNAYKAKRKEKARIHAERMKRGWKPKKKVSLEEYKKNLETT